MTETEIVNLDITVAIPTYNRASHLPQLLERLLNQTKVEHLNWEIIIVDNNSTDNTAEVIRDSQTKWKGNFPLRYFRETEQGAAFARLRSVREAKGQLIGFLDDDNLPAPDWVAQAVAFDKEHPQAGAWGGQIHGDFEVQPPEKFERIQAFLAIREHGEQPHLFDPDNLRLPPAAALVVRKQAWCDNVPQRPILTGKLPGLLVQGDDYEPLLYIHKARWQIWYNPTMHSYHQIPYWRLEKDYLLSLARGCGLCICQLRFINAKNWQKPIVFIRTFVGNLRRLLQHFIQYKGQSQSDIIALFEMEFYWGSMMSSLYLVKYYLSSVLSKKCK
ncbi:hormogonium polysaccharide biosynthesis glycosyltransferase HpsE [Mastigocladopsis repens]|uniref:hormogonium polysaccharide biosynthesis glycosyltransferase HpsE n=1 Tax=Mastigocladopsis repens TaxID=221287 RepID=UPI0008FC104A|nr:hormogonium polysaccharide biosynthesis glycosyltransferase HpsE [Mastigocladopsis repens]